MPYDVTIKIDNTEIRKEIEQLEELKAILEELYKQQVINGKDYELRLVKKKEV